MTSIDLDWGCTALLTGVGLEKGSGAVVGTETLWTLLSPFPPCNEDFPILIAVPHGSGYGCVSLHVLWSLLKGQGAVTDWTAMLLVSAPGWLDSLNSAPSQSSGRDCDLFSEASALLDPGHSPCMRGSRLGH